MRLRSPRRAVWAASDYDVRYTVTVCLPDDGPPPSAQIVQAAVCAALDLPSESVRAEMFLPMMAG